MKDKKNVLFCARFFALCLIPLAGMAAVGPAEPAGNEVLPDPPALIGADGKANLAFLTDLSDYIDLRFAFRQEMITADRRVHTALLRDSATEDVIWGAEGWLFYGETLHSYEGLDNLTERETWCAAHLLSMVQDYCARQGAEFRFVVAPDKNTIYGQYMPKRYPKEEGPSELEALTAAMEREAVAYVDVLTPLAEQEDVLYRKHDSHWTARGAGLAGDVLLSSLHQPFTPFYGGEYSPVWEEQGDLYEMLFPAGRELDRDERYARVFSFSYTAPIRSAEDLFIRTERAGAGGSLLMFRDSFGNALHPFLAEAFGKAVFCRQTPYDLTLIETEAADTVVIELVERNLRWLIQRPAVFPAPTAEVRAEPAGFEAGVTVEGAEALEGYSAVTGELAGLRPDTDSPVYLHCGSVWYEASPTGERTFTAYLPRSAAESITGVGVLSGGRLLEGAAVVQKAE